jgi:hypothetical protein
MTLTLDCCLGSCAMHGQTFIITPVKSKIGFQTATHTPAAQVWHLQGLGCLTQISSLPGPGEGFCVYHVPLSASVCTTYYEVRALLGSLGCAHTATGFGQKLGRPHLRP